MLELPAMSDGREALKRAISEVGGPACLARAVGISIQAIMQWEEVPPRRVIAVERATGIPREELRPDLYPTEARA